MVGAIQGIGAWKEAWTFEMKFLMMGKDYWGRLEEGGSNLGGTFYFGSSKVPSGSCSRTSTLTCQYLSIQPGLLSLSGAFHSNKAILTLFESQSVWVSGGQAL